jgi:hypothetical protein
MTRTAAAIHTLCTPAVGTSGPAAWERQARAPREERS